MSQINRATILKGFSAPRVRKIDTPEWGDNGFVYVCELQASDATQVQRLGDAAANGKVDESRALAGWCILGICDKTGKRILTNEDMDAMLAAPLAVVQRCALAIMEINGLTEEGESARKKSTGRSAKAVRVRPRKRTGARRR